MIDPDVLATIREQLEVGTGVYQLSTHMQHMAGYSSIVDRFHAESDRAAAVLGGAALDHYLAEALKGFLVSDEETNELFGKYGPLSTFAARIDMAFALGLISADLKGDFNFIRRIRNHFAHHVGEATKARADLAVISGEVAAVRNTTVVADLSLQIASLRTTIEGMKKQLEVANKPRNDTKTQRPEKTAKKAP